jgi:hypothetical protein
VKPRLLIGLAVVLAIVVFGWLVYRDLSANEELASKPEWAAIQIIEMQHSEKPRPDIEFVKVDAYTIVGIPVPDARKTIWIMLNPSTPPFYKQLPSGGYTLSQKDLKIILASGVVTSTVRSCLESHVVAEK